jgi:hypothetical protein
MKEKMTIQNKYVSNLAVFSLGFSMEKSEKQNIIHFTDLVKFHHISIQDKIV